MAKRYVVFALVLLMAWTAGAQSFRVSVDASKELGRNFTLLVYDTDSQPRVVKPKGKKGPVTFEDDVKDAVYAELRHRKIDTPLPFFLEGADITIKYNSANPEASAITGSRSNSQLRYQLEQCDGDIGCLAQYVQENPTSPVAPYILERYVSTSVSYETVAALFRQLGGDAVKSYHYRRLQQRLHQLEALAEGSPIPSFSYTGSDNRTVKIDSVLTGGSYNLIIVGATYCSQCQRIEKEVRGSFKNVHPVVIDVDRQKDGWDAPLLKLLDIDHVPYLILLDKDRRIVARDLRIWQLKRTLEQQPANANKNKQ